MRDYLECPRRKGRPKIAIDVCRQCKHKAGCKTFEHFQNPPLFSEIRHGLRPGQDS